MNIDWSKTFIFTGAVIFTLHIIMEILNLMGYSFQVYNGNILTGIVFYLWGSKLGLEDQLNKLKNKK
jgi:hypothetical protein